MYGLIRDMIVEWKYKRAVARAERKTEEIAAGFKELYILATTFHGRMKLAQVISAAEEGELEIDPTVVSMFRFVLTNTPYTVYSHLN